MTWRRKTVERVGARHACVDRQGRYPSSDAIRIEIRGPKCDRPGESVHVQMDDSRE